MENKDMNLGDRMKFYETQFETRIDPKDTIIIRIDGHKFSKFTKGFVKPFDSILSKAMELTTIDLVEEYQAVTGYTQSDEITLVIPSLMNTDNHKGTDKPQWKHTFDGRVQKMVSLISAFTTMRFNKHFERLSEFYGVDENYDKRYRFLMSKVGNAYFDCRIYGVPNEDEAFNSVMFRARDCVKNSKSMFSQTFCSHKELQKKTGPEQVEYCLEKTGKDWNDVEDRYKYGILVKREKYLKPVPERTMDYGQSEFVERSRTVIFSQQLTNFSDENVELVMRKFK